ncbi:MAG: arginine repressor [Clostridiales bacterium]|nr:arginine repressor [Clostridiales bacterium]
MKKKRHEAIIELINNFDINTQDELLVKLQESGFDVTQATISRDIKELRLVKTVGENGQYKYAVNSAVEDNINGNISLFKGVIISVECAVNMLVIKSSSGMAQAVCATIDAMKFEGVVGTLAGDDTIFIACASEETAKQLKNTINKMLG